MSATTNTTKYVYFFGAGRAEGSSVMRNLLGGKGCELAEMTNLGIPVPPGFTVTTQAWVHSQRAGGKWPGRALGADAGASRAARGGGRRALRRPRPPAPGLGAVGRARVDARHDGDDPEPRTQRRHRRGAGARGRATSASPGTATAASSRCSRRVVLGIKREVFDEHARRPEGAPRRDEPTPMSRPASCGSSCRPTRTRSRRARGARSRRTRATSCAWPSTRCSTPGSPRRRRSTAASTASPRTGAPR